MDRQTHHRIVRYIDDRITNFHRGIETTKRGSVIGCSPQGYRKNHLYKQYRRKGLLHG